jgi:hypothetical protein
LIVGGDPAAYSFRLRDESAEPPATTDPPDTTEPPATPEQPAEPLRVNIDVLPRCTRNHWFGLIPVVIFGSDTVDVDDLDLRTVELEGMPLWTLFGRPVAIEVDADRDGHLDVVGLIVDLSGAIPAQATNVTLTAGLDDGTPIEGSDAICLRGRVVSFDGINWAAPTG